MTISLRDTGGITKKTQSGKDGTFAILGLGAGQYLLRSFKAGYLDEQLEVGLDAGESYKRIDLELDQALEIRVLFRLPDGRRVRDVHKELQLGVSGSLLAVAMTDPPPGHLPLTAGHEYKSTSVSSYYQSYESPDSRYHPAECDGVLFVKTSLPVVACAVYGHLVLDTIPVSEPLPELVFVVDPLMITQSFARVLLEVYSAETDAPLPETRITFGRRDARQTSFPDPATGAAVIEPVEPGVYGLQLTAAGYERYQNVVYVQSGEKIDLGRIYLAPEVCIEGRAVAADGAGVPGARVSARRMDRSSLWEPLSEQTTTTTGESGTFRLCGLGRGPYALRAWHEGAGSASIVHQISTAGGGVAAIFLDLRPATPVTLEARPGATPYHLVVVAGGINHRVWYVHDQGSFHLNLLPGEYTVQAVDLDGSVLASAPLSVGAEPLLQTVEP